MAGNAESLVRAGIQAYRQGDKTQARSLLERAIQEDQYSEQAWLWLSAVVTTPEEQRTCLENVLVINPNNERARMGLNSLGVDPATAAPEPAEPEPESVWNDDIIATSSASSSFQDDAYSGDEIDDWIASTGIGSSGDSEPATATSFDKYEDLEDDDSFGRDELFASDTGNLFDDDPTVQSFDDLDEEDLLFSDDSDGFDEAESAYAGDDLFDDDEDLFGDSGGDAGFGDYGDDADFADGGYDDFGDEDDLFGDEPYDAGDEFDNYDSGYVDEERREFDPTDINDSEMGEFSEIISDGFMDDDDDEFFEQLDDDLFDEYDEEGEPIEPAGPGPDDYFVLIPREIEAAGRLPGEPMPRPMGLLIGIGVLAVMNLGAIVFAVSQVAG